MKIALLKQVLITLFVFLSFESLAQTYCLKGVVSQKDTNIALSGANVIILEANQGVYTDRDGRFTFFLRGGNYTIKVSYMGYSSYSQEIAINSDANIQIPLFLAEQELKELIISDNKNQQSIENPQTGMVKLSMIDMKRLPVFLGESDPIKAIRLTPGVQAGGEGNAGIFVRGGNPGQNLILLEDMPIYNPNHLLGLYSVFNPSIIKNVSLYKGVYPSNYGGRASSLIKIGLSDGIPDRVETEASLGLISSRFGIKTPILNSKASLLLGGRVTYLQVLQPLFSLFKVKNKNISNNRYNFNDFNARLELNVSPKNKLILNSYSGVDKYELIKSTIGVRNEMNWGNRAAMLKWIHVFNSDLSWSNTIGFTSYFFNLKAGYQQYSIKLKSNITDPFFRTEVLYSRPKHFFQFGVESTFHNIKPESADVKIDESLTNSKLSYRTAEISAFINDSYEVSPKITILGGLRVTTYAQLGGYSIFNTDAQGVVIDTVSYRSNELVKAYFGIEPRLSVCYKSSNLSSYKFSFSRNYQFIHLISVGTVSLPTDIWFPSTKFIKPEFSDQITLGYFRDFYQNRYAGSFEVYFKRLQNIIEFKNSLVAHFKNNEFEKSISPGKGLSFGAEWYFQKKIGPLTGWISYTLAWSIRKFNDINDGKYYFDKYDRRHDLAITLSYQLKNHWSLSTVFIYSTGNAMTLPAGRYMIQGEIVNDYTSVNSFRMPAYHRMDISVSHIKRIRDKFESTWNFSVYNVYNRANPYYVFFEAKGDLDSYSLSVKAKKVSLFPILPSVSWTLKF